MNDSDLIRRFADEQSQEAFAELVRRRIGLVYAAALRQVGDAHRAEDVTQEVFVDLARKARSLTRHPTLIGWLYTTTHFAAAKLVRTEQRRARREQEVNAMNDPIAPTAAAPDWDRVRPVLDVAMHELDERDRQTVLLRFFDQQPFARIGEQLGLSENAAQKAVDRALDKLQAALARRGVTSTGAALGVALAGQAAAAVPAALAASITGAALAGTGVAGGFLAAGGASKAVAGLSVVVAMVAGGMAVSEHRRAAEARAIIASAEPQQRAWRAEITKLTARAEQAEWRTAEAEKDNGALLKAVEAARAGAAAAKAGPVSTSAARLPEEEGRVFQQRLARRRADEAKARAQVDGDAAAASDDPAKRFFNLMAVAEKYLADDDFPAGIRIYNQAMQRKPADLVVPEPIKELQAKLVAQNTPVDVTLISDGLTTVSLEGSYGVRPPSPLQTGTVRVMPANYEIIGRRAGYQDVVVPVQVRNGVPAPVVTVVCTVPAAP